MPQKPLPLSHGITDAATQRAVRQLEQLVTDQSTGSAESLFTATTSGIVPASGGSGLNFLCADGTWKAPAGGGISLPIAESDVTGLVSDLAAKASIGRSILTTAPLTGGGDLSADRTLAVSQFDATHAGIVPASGGGATAFLRADGTWAAPTTPSVIPYGPYGDGSDGNVTISSNTTLARDMFYNNLTVNSGVTLRTGGFRVHVQGLLSLSGSIDNSGYPGQNGNSSSTALAGAGGDIGSTGGGAPGGNGGFNGGGAIGSRANPAPRGVSSAGVGGFGAVAGGSAGTPVFAAASNGEIRDAFGAYLAKNPATLTTNLLFGSGGGGGTSNGPTVGAGAGGGGGGYVYVAARTWTGAGSVTSFGGQGGNAVVSASVASGGGGGGSGGVVAFVTQMSTAPTLATTGGSGGAPSGASPSTAGGSGGSGFTMAFNI